MDNLTRKQRDVYEFIKSEVRSKGFPPTVREICYSVGFRSTSSVHAHLRTLEKKGYIRRVHSKNRSIEILEENFYGQRNIHEIPLIGKITAGIPIQAIEDIEEVFPIPYSYLNRHDEFFILKVQGDSMLEKGINDGDLAIIKKQRIANNGDIVAALIDDFATIKTFFKENGYIRLQPQNPSYEPIISKNVVILGKLAGLIRFFHE